MAIVARYCRKSNQFQSVQGLGMHRTHKNICKSKKQKESDAVATLVVSYCRKLISSNLYRGIKCKEPIKLFISSSNEKRSVAIALQHLLPGSVEKLVSSNLCWGLECKEETIKMFIYR